MLVLVTKRNTFSWVFFTFFKCTNGTNSPNLPHDVFKDTVLSELLELSAFQPFDLFSVELLSVIYCDGVLNVMMIWKIREDKFSESSINSYKFIMTSFKGHLSGAKI